MTVRIIKKVIMLAMGFQMGWTVMFGVAFGETISFSGNVAAKNEIQILSDKRGKVSSVEVRTGELVKEGQIVLTLATEKIFSPADGVVSLINVKPGDAASSVTDRFGALLFVEDQYSFEISASVDSAYNAADNKLVHPGETVRVVSTDNKHTGTGLITRIDKNQYNVLIRSGMFSIGESVIIYRNQSASEAETEETAVEETDEGPENPATTEIRTSTKGSASDRIGRGNVERVTPYAIKGTGNVVMVHVREGQQVRSGDVLCEMIDAGINGHSDHPNTITASATGIIGNLRVSPGDEVKINDVIAAIYPSEEVVIRGRVSEFEVRSLQVGDDVEIEMFSNQGESRIYPGTIASISLSSSQSENKSDGSVSFEVTVDFETTDTLYYGMSAVVNVNKH